jgi:hypothetical protein
MRNLVAFTLAVSILSSCASLTARSATEPLPPATAYLAVFDDLARVLRDTYEVDVVTVDAGNVPHTLIRSLHQIGIAVIPRACESALPMILLGPPEVLGPGQFAFPSASGRGDGSYLANRHTVNCTSGACHAENILRGTFDVRVALGSCD